MAAGQPGLKVLQVGSSLFDWGGIERYLLYLRDGLAARGHKVECVVPPGSPLDSRLSGTKHGIALRGQFRFGLLPRYVKLMRSARYDVIHVHFSPDFIIPAMAARIARQRFVLMTRHVALPWNPVKVRRYLRLFQHIIPVSEAVQRRLGESGVPQSRMTVAKAGTPALIPSGDREAVRREAGINGFAVGCFGRLVREKGVDTLVRAAGGSDKFSCHIFGQGEAERELRALTATLRHPGQLSFHGVVEDVARSMDAMDAIAVPSVWEEAFPFSVLEAMSLGKPVLASRIGGIPEMVEDGTTGLLFESADHGALRSKAEALAGDPSLCRRMGQAALERHRAEFTVEAMAERIESVYRAQLEGLGA